MRKSFMELVRYLFLPNTLYLGYKKVRSDYISRPIPHCRSIDKKDAMGFLVLKSKRACRKTQWLRRYCVIYDKELVLYKDQTGKSDDMETCRISLLSVLEFTVRSQMVPEATKVSKNKATIRTKPICRVKIVDEKRKQYELGIMDEKDAVYWTNSFYWAFFRAKTPSKGDCHCDAKSMAQNSAKGDYRSYFLRSQIEETRTFVVRSTVVMERNIDDESMRKRVHERHWAAKSELTVDDNLLNESGSLGAKDVKKSRTSSKIVTPQSTKSKISNVSTFSAKTRTKGVK